MLLEAIGPAGRCRGGVVLDYDLLVSPPAFTSFVTLTRAPGPGRGLPVATGSLPNAIDRAKTAEGSRACFLSGFPGRVGAEESGAA